MYIYTYNDIYIYMYIEREREIIYIYIYIYILSYRRPGDPHAARPARGPGLQRHINGVVSKDTQI